MNQASTRQEKKERKRRGEWEKEEKKWEAREDNPQRQIGRGRASMKRKRSSEANN
jgi:hypothetical protein